MINTVLPVEQGHPRASQIPSFLTSPFTSRIQHLTSLQKTRDSWGEQKMGSLSMLIGTPPNVPDFYFQHISVSKALQLLHRLGR